jgi:HlyD family secretion protein
MSKFFTKKRVIWTIVILLIIGGIWYFAFGRPKTASNVSTDKVTRQNLQQTVLSTGQVVSSVDLSLSFQGNGVVKQVNVKEGDHVKAGQTLATLDQTSAHASLTQAQGSLAQAKANYETVAAGSTSQQITVSQKAVNSAQVSLDNANAALANTKAQQDTAVNNAYNSLLNTTFSAIPGSGNTDNVSVTVSGTYTGNQEGVYTISIYATGAGLKFQANGLESASGNVGTQLAALGSNGLSIQFSATPTSSDTWTITIPNTYAASYTQNYNAYQTALKTRDAQVSSAQSQVSSAQSSLEQAQASLAQTQAQATSAQLDSAKAQVLSAQGQVEAAQGTLNNTILKAPSDGTITSVDIKVGEQASASQEAVVLQDVGDMHAEANVSEANIASLKVGQSVDYTFDALGPDTHFSGTVQTIDSASTIISGVVDYKVTANIENAPDIKPGMTANMTILVAKKDNALAVPSSAVINESNGNYVRVIDDSKKLTYHEVQVQTGLQADGGLVEITSGLTEGQEIVTSIQ